MIIKTCDETFDDKLFQLSSSINSQPLYEQSQYEQTTFSQKEMTPQQSNFVVNELDSFYASPLL